MWIFWKICRIPRISILHPNKALSIWKKKWNVHLSMSATTILFKKYFSLENLNKQKKSSEFFFLFTKIKRKNIEKLRKGNNFLVKFCFSDIKSIELNSWVNRTKTKPEILGNNRIRIWEWSLIRINDISGIKLCKDRVSN